MLWSSVALALPVQIEVVEDTRRDRWEVTWRFEAPVYGIAFVRNRNLFRAGRWKAKGARLTEVDGYEVLLSKRGPVDSLTATFDTWTDNLARDYELNLAFGDGSRLLYAEHLTAVALRCPDDADRCEPQALQADDFVPPRFTFTTDPDRHIAVPGRRDPGTLSIEDDRVFVYFGDIEPLRDDRITALIDPTAPEWIVELSRELLPELLDLYSAWTGATLSEQPMVLLSWEEGRPGGLDYAGGGLPGQVQLSVSGQAWRQPTPDLRLEYATFLAHEAFHLWNGGQFRTRLDGSEEWLTEGSATLYAHRAMLALGRIDQAAYADRLRTEAQRCAPRLRSGPLLTAPARGEYRGFYDCGAIALAHLDHRIGQATDGAHDLTSVLARVWAEAAEGDRTYSTWALFEAVQAITADPMVVAPTERILRQGLADPFEALAGLLDAVGVPTRTAPLWTDAGASGQALFGALATAVGVCDCQGRISVWDRGEALEFDAVPECSALAEGIRATHIAGVPLTERARALEALWDQIDAGGPITLSSPEANLEAACPDIPPRPRTLLAE